MIFPGNIFIKVTQGNDKVTLLAWNTKCIFVLIHKMD